LWIIIGQKGIKLKFWVHTEQKLDEISPKFKHFAQKSLKTLQTGNQGLKFQVAYVPSLQYF
jgi:hypothetical protein